MAECEVTAEPGGVARPGQRSASRPGPAARINDQLRESRRPPLSDRFAPVAARRRPLRTPVFCEAVLRLRVWS
jgi:hypothetical protein